MSQNQTITVTIRAIDGSTQVFKAIGQSAQTAATQVQAAGSKAGAGLTTVDTAAAKANASVKSLGTTLSGFNARSAAIAGGAATIAGLLADAARAAAEEDAIFTRLQSSVEATGVSYESLGQSIDGAIAKAQQLSFEDGNTAEALATLTQTTGNASQAIDLLGVTMDLARGKNLDLNTAATVIGKVAAGNTAILARYGIVLDQNASSTEALAAIQQRFAGQAKAFSETNAGAAERFTNALHDQAEALGQSTGALQQFLVLAPGLSSTYTAATAALGGLTRAIPALTALTGPLGVGLAAVTAAGVLLVKNWQDQKQAAIDIAAAYADASKQLQGLADTTSAATAQQALIVSADDLNKAYANLNGVFATMHVSLQDYALDGQEVTQVNQDIASSMKAAGDDTSTVAFEVDSLTKAHLAGTIAGKDLIPVLDDLNTILENQAPGWEAAREETFKAIDAWGSGITTGQQLAQTLDTIAQSTLQVVDATQAAIDAQNKARQDILASSAAQNTITPGLSSLERTPSQIANDQAALQEASNQRAIQRAAEQAAASEKAARDAASAKAEAERQAKEAAEAYAQQLQDATTYANDLAGSLDDAGQAQQDATQAAQEHASALADIAKQAKQQQHDLDQQEVQDIRDLQRQRIDAERQTVQTINGLESQRRDLATQTEQQLADLAKQRGEIQADVASKVADAEANWLQQQQDFAAKEQDIRQQLAQTASQAREQWQQTLEDIKSRAEEIKATLRSTLSDNDLQTKRDLADNATAQKRILEDLKRTLGDPTVSDEQKQQAKIEAERQLQDLATQRHRLEQDHDRAEKEARQEAKQQEQALADQRKAAAKQYQEAIQQAQQAASDQFQALQKQEAEANQKRIDAETAARQDAAKQLADLADQQTQLQVQAAQKDAELRHQEEIAQRDLAREQQTNARDLAQVQEKYARETANIQQQANRQVAEENRQYQEAQVSQQDKLTELLNKGVITQEEFNKASAAAKQIQGDQLQIEDDTAALHARELPDLAAALRQERLRLDAELKINQAISDRPTETGSTVKQESVKPATVKIDAAGVVSGIDDATRAAEAFTSKVYIATLDVDPNPVGKTVSTEQVYLQRYWEGTYLGHLDVEASAAEGHLADARRDLDIFSRTTYQAHLDADPGNAAAGAVGGGLIGALAESYSALKEYGATTETASLDADNSAVSGTIADTQDDLDRYSRTTYMAHLTADVGDASKGASPGGGVVGALAETYDALDVYTKSGPYSVDLDGDNRGVFQSLSQARAALRAFANETYTATIDASLAYSLSSSKRSATTDTGRALGGVIGAALGRTVVVGEAGPETLTLPFGSRIMPDGGAKGRAAGPALVQNIFPNARFELKDADIARQVSRYLAASRR